MKNLITLLLFVPLFLNGQVLKKLNEVNWDVSLGNNTIVRHIEFFQLANDTLIVNSLIFDEGNPLEIKTITWLGYQSFVEVEKESMLKIIKQNLRILEEKFNYKYEIKNVTYPNLWIETILNTTYILHIYELNIDVEMKGFFTKLEINEIIQKRS